ncbi:MULTISPECIES: LysE family translocator [unclassified Pseudomonas]|uniref:LysE family translocator n=1 Tax=unclassified Pseudomonas TaxID=196821 RepID=UPI000C882A77|nr:MULTISPECIES: LysE family transporter [unclassified Pseudomonas]PMZ94212.1 lysine transporter LysE [Pseudomonas sp. FW305-42]PNA21305.1 lysine transporter LysE [Pseudomonas sp. MPR-R1B]PNB23897.1 lysine transporter LysE [Pseudomonas sp. DP16D-E2]PNB41700.1 lysine transporter LysE [Pseudomonas sp. FW305-17]PNB57765.1 lysine transporter LysE [Pseudomonas sp. GW531-E2]
MAMSVLTAFWAVSLLFVITPGADWAYAISAGMRGRWVVPAVAGMLSGHLLVTLVVAAGVGSLIAGHPLALTLLTLAGCVYLLWLGGNLLLSPAVPEAGAGGEQDSGSRWAFKGLCVSGLNPKVFLLFLALLPQFTDPQSSWPLPLQILLLGLVHLGSSLVIYLMVGYGAKAVLRTRPAAAQAVGRLSGGVMILIAVGLIAGQLR